jgi:ABC-type glycerol-3-phosphate transport system permease component
VPNDRRGAAPAVPDAVPERATMVAAERGPEVASSETSAASERPVGSILSRRSPYRIPFLILGYAMLLAVALMMALPFIWMLSTSLKTPGTEFRYPPEFLPRTFDATAYERLFTLVDFGGYFINTIIVTAGTVAGQLVICSMAAYAFARLHFIGRDLIFIFFLATMMIPFQITLIPLYLMVHAAGGLNTYWGLIVPGISSAFGIFLLRQAFLTVPRDLQDAARVDGASEWAIYSRIFLPLNFPALATLGVFAFMATWTDLLWPLLIAREERLRTLELGLAYFTASASGFGQLTQPNWPLIMAAAVVVMLPVIVVYFVAQRYFVEGISLTGVKG